jgi:hypothetical protein
MSETKVYQFGEKVRRDKEIADLRGQMAEMSSILRELMGTIQAEKLPAKPVKRID